MSGGGEIEPRLSELESLNLENLDNVELLQPSIIGWQKSVVDIEKIITNNDWLKKENGWLASLAFYLALEAQVETLKEVNDEDISCPVPWDRTTGFPTHPTVIADSFQHAQSLEEGLLKSILYSFSDWTHLMDSKIFCMFGHMQGSSSGSLGLKRHEVNYSVWIRNVLGINNTLDPILGSGLLIKQLIGICADNKHFFENRLEEVSKDDPRPGGMVIVWKCENTLKVDGNSKPLVLDNNSVSSHVHISTILDALYSMVFQDFPDYDQE